MTVATPLSIETPSGKDTAYENFPVGSWLLPARLRPHVAVFYDFARGADDIADSPDLPPEEKVARLEGFEGALLGRETENPAFRKAHRMRESLAETGVTPRHCADLLAAFTQDATKLRYEDWDNLIGYCTLSAASVGRYMLDLHGGSRHGYEPSDALCMGLQIINHLQDCRDDYRRLNRVYLPLAWMEEAGAAVEDLDAPTTNSALRKVLDRTLDGVEALLTQARAMPGGVRNRRLAMESAGILAIANRLTGLLRRRDPLVRRVELSKPGYLWCCLVGVLAAGFRA